jgi:hypothetical protein
VTKALPVVASNARMVLSPRLAAQIVPLMPRKDCPVTTPSEHTIPNNPEIKPANALTWVFISTSASFWYAVV